MKVIPKDDVDFTIELFSTYMNTDMYNEQWTNWKIVTDCLVDWQ